MNNNKVALITGGSRGIGKATSILLAKKGYNIALNYFIHDHDALMLKSELENKYQTKVLLCKYDISNEDEVKRMMIDIKKEFGKIDFLINNAGIAIDNSMQDKTVDEFKKVIGVNLVGTFIVTKLAFELMSKGAIVNVASTDGIDTNYPEESDYVASKAAVISLTRTMAKTYAPNIRVNAVAPGWVNTDMNKELYANFKKEQEDKILLNRFGEANEIANVIYFLCTDEASYINGSIIRVDGGMK